MITVINEKVGSSLLGSACLFSRDVNNAPRSARLATIVTFIVFVISLKVWNIEGNFT